MSLICSRTSGQTAHNILVVTHAFWLQVDILPISLNFVCIAGQGSLFELNLSAKQVGLKV